jgi:hypothetical protein
VPVTAKELRDLVKTFPWDEWNKKLAPKMTQIYRDLVESSGDALAKAHSVSFDMDDPFLQEHMTGYIGERITQLSRTSKKDVTRALTSALSSGKDLGIADLRDLITDTVREKFDGYEAWRSLRIARTESAIGYNHGNVLGAAQAGFGEVDVIDGTDDEECDEANGDTWTIDEALDDPIAHPNCVRTFVPHVDDAALDAA